MPTSPQFLKRTGKPDLAYHHIAGHGPCLMFCGGFRSDMAGTKALYFEEQCRARGQAYLRFDYSGHGESGGAFTEGTIGTWLEDALAVFDAVIDGPVVIVGSSMGGWIGLLMAKARADHVKGFIGIAAAPDFTEILYAQTLNDTQRALVESQGFLEEPNEYSDTPYIFTKALFDDGRKHLILPHDQDAEIPMRLLHGMRDTSVASNIPLKIQECYTQADCDVIFIDDGDHRLSRPEDLVLIDQNILDISAC